MIAEHNGSTGAVITDCVYSRSKLIAKVSGGTTHYFLSDRLSTRLVLDTGGNVIGRQGHFPFAEEFAESGTQDTHHFTKYERDGETGTDYAVNRQYSRSVGRFMRVDPYNVRTDGEIPQNWNRFSYVLNDPVNMLDPLGLNACTIFFNASGRTTVSYPKENYGVNLGDVSAGAYWIFLLEIQMDCTGPGSEWYYDVWVETYEFIPWLNADTGRQEAARDLFGAMDRNDVINPKHTRIMNGTIASAYLYEPFTFRNRRKFGRKGILYPNGGFMRWIINVRVEHKTGHPWFYRRAVLTLNFIAYHQGRFSFSASLLEIHP